MYYYERKNTFKYPVAQTHNPKVAGSNPAPATKIVLLAGSSLTLKLIVTELPAIFIGRKQACLHSQAGLKGPAYLFF